MNILIFDHLAINRSYQEAYYLLSRKFNHNITVYVPKDWNEYGIKTNCYIDSTPYFRVKYVKTFFNNKVNRVIYRISIKDLISKNPDIILINGEPENFSVLFFAVLKKIKLKKINLIAVSWRNIDFSVKDHPYKFGIIYWLIEKYTLKYIDGIIAFNVTALKIFKLKMFKKIHYIPMGVNLNTFYTRVTTNENEVKERFCVGFIGRFEHSKGVHLLLEAISNLDEKFTCKIVGSGPLKNFYLELAQNKMISNRVEIIDGVDHLDVPKILKSLNVLVLPSQTTTKWIEQFGRVLIEAMACGIPVIGSSSGEIPSVIGDAGLIFQEDNVTELYKCIKLLKENDILREKLIKNGLSRVKDLFSWDVVIPQWNEFFLRVMKSNSMEQ